MTEGTEDTSKGKRSNRDDETATPRKPLRASLFQQDAVASLQDEYKNSEPYRHLVIPDLMDDEVLVGACEELKTNMQATLKETDIFKVYQTGDLANMDGLPEESKRLLPSLFSIRDGLYSLEFRRLVQSLTGSGPLSGEQIDLSVNAFGHTGHLLCHDDVIGTRKVSYILYLVDKDWGSGEKPDGGGLQLYPLEDEGVPGVPAYAPSKTIAPRWNQMVLFAVQPGRSFHDVQEVYNENKPRLAVSGWFHGALPSEMRDWPEHVPNGQGSNGGREDASSGGEETTASTLEQLKGKVGGAERSGPDDGSPGAFEDDFSGTEDLKELAQWVNPEYLLPSMVDQCAAAFTENGSTIQLHRFLKDDIARKIVDAAIKADRSDGLGYMEASAFDAGVRGGWKKAGPPHRQRMLRLSSAEPGQEEDQQDDEIGSLLRSLRDKLFRSRAFKALLEKMLGDTPVLASRRQARRFRPGLDYTLATPGAPWVWRHAAQDNGQTSVADVGSVDGVVKLQDGARSSKCSAENSDIVNADDVESHDTSKERKGDVGKDQGQDKEEQEDYMVLDAVLCFVDDREPYKEAAWRQDEVGGYVTYLGGDEEEEEEEGQGDQGGSEKVDCKDVMTSVEEREDGKEGGAESAAVRTSSSESGSVVGIGSSGGGREGGGAKNDAAVYKADEGGSLVSVSAASNALSLVLRDDAGIANFVKYVSSAAPGSRFDVAAEYLVLGTGEDDDDDGDSITGTAGSRSSVMLETVPEGDSEEEEEEEEGEGAGDWRSRKRLKA